MKRIESEYAIECYPDYGPQFGDNIYIYNIIYLSHFIIHNDGTRGYECHSEYKSSLFVNTAGSDEGNKFSVVDYEVYTHK